MIELKLFDKLWIAFTFLLLYMLKKTSFISFL